MACFHVVVVNLKSNLLKEKCRTILSLIMDVISVVEAVSVYVFSVNAKDIHQTLTKTDLEGVDEVKIMFQK